MRLFVAIELSPAIRSALERLQNALRSQCDGVRWIPPDQLHLTLKFAGEVRDADVEKLALAMREVASKTIAFSMSVTDCGCFPPRGPVRIVWAGVQESDGVLERCATEVEQAFERRGIPRDVRAFSPHITIGRVREDRSGGRLRAAADKGSLSPVSQSVASLTLMSSVLSPKGPTYTPVATGNLGSPSP